MTMALLYHPNRALFSVYLSRLPLCASSILDLPVVVPAGALERSFVSAEDEMHFLPQVPAIHNEKDFLAKNHRYKPGGFKE